MTHLRLSFLPTLWCRLYYPSPFDIGGFRISPRSEKQLWLEAKRTERAASSRPSWREHLKTSAVMVLFPPESKGSVCLFLSKLSSISIRLSENSPSFYLMWPTVALPHLSFFCVWSSSLGSHFSLYLGSWCRLLAWVSVCHDLCLPDGAFWKPLCMVLRRMGLVSRSLLLPLISFYTSNLEQP